MQDLEERGVTIDFCAGCKGTWLDKSELAAFASDEVRAALVNESLLEGTLFGARKSSMCCPVCASAMTEGGLFAEDFEIDRCDKCSGIWFDRRELTRLGDLQAPRKPPKGTKPSGKSSRKETKEHSVVTIARALEKAGVTPRASGEPLCPVCRRGPSIKDLWQCTCGWVWNVFRTGAQCPSCGHHWKETRCPGCGAWSPHVLWYAG